MDHSTVESSRLETLISEGRAALLAGEKARAQSLLEAAVRLDARNEEAWVWLSGAQPTPAAMAACLQQVLQINPDNEQALEGLRWIAAEHGVQPEPSAASTPEPAHLAEPIVLRPRYSSAHGISALVEAALHPLAAGVLLGLLRLVGWLRPGTLLLMRGSAGPLGTGGALSVALTAALLHGLALLVVWLILGWQISRVRVQGRGDRFDSLVRAGQLWPPAYLWAAALVLVAGGLGLSPAPWRIVGIVGWALLLGGAALIGRRLWHLLLTVEIAAAQRSRVMARLLLVLIVAAVLGLGLAGAVTAAMLS